MLCSTTAKRICILAIAGFISAFSARAASIRTNYVDHLTLRSDHPDVAVDFGDQTGGMEITSRTKGNFSSGEFKFASIALQVPPKRQIMGVRVCFESTGA